MRCQAIYLPIIELAELDHLLRPWSERHPASGLVCLLAEADRDKIPLLQRCAIELGLSLTGAVFPELIENERFHPTGAVLLMFDRPVPYRLVTLDDGATELSRITGDLDEETHSLFMVFDGMLGNVASLLDGIYLELGDRVSYWGVNAGSETFTSIPCLFDNQTTLANAVLCLYLTDSQAAILGHGYGAPDRAITATSTTGNRVTTIDWRPAFDVYAELIADAYGTEVNRDDFYQMAVHFPLGILRMDGEILVRIPVHLDDDGAISCVGEIPQNALLTLLDASQAHTPVDMAAAVRQANTPLLGFYCAGRRMHLGKQAACEEIASIRRHADNPQLLGALSLGEIGSTRQGSYPLFHNACIVLKALRQP